MGKKEISIIIPCYNDGRFLNDALNSLTKYSNVIDEVIIVDDGSTDAETLAVLQTIQSKNIRLIRQENKGLSAARNAGIRACRSPYFIPLDSDNKLSDGYFGEGLDLLKSHPKASYVYGDYLEFGERNQYRKPGPFNPLRLLIGNYIDACALIRRNAWEEAGGYDENMKLGYEDWGFWLQLLEKNLKGMYLPKLSFHYRVRPDSLLATTNEENNRRSILQYILQKNASLVGRYAGELVPELLQNRLEYELQNQALRVTLIHEKNLALHELAQAWEGRLKKEKEELAALLEEKRVQETERLQQELSRRVEEFHLTVQHYNNLLEDMKNSSEELRVSFTEEKIRLFRHIENLDEQLILLAQREQHNLREAEGLKALVNQLEERIRYFESTIYFKLAGHWQRLKLLLRSGDAKGRRIFGWFRRIIFMFSAKGRVIVRRFLKKVFRALYIMLEEGPVTILVGYDHARNPLTFADTYAHWRYLNDPRPQDLKFWKEDVRHFKYQPLISVVVPVYDPPIQLLKELIDSIFNQIYENWELCIADDASTDETLLQYLRELRDLDPRIKVTFRSSNGHISACTNSSLELATGEFVVLVDQDDLLPAEALYHVVRELNLFADTDIIYTDEDKIDEEGRRFMPHFKPQWCPESFLSRNYLGHLIVIRRSLLQSIGGFRLGFEGSQDYDMLLRATEKADKIRRIPRILYHWRVHSRSAAQSEEAKPYAYMAARKALLEALQRRGEPAEVDYLPGFRGYHIRFKITRPGKVSIIIPAFNKADITARCIDSLFEKTAYQDICVHLLSNNSTEKSFFTQAESWSKKYVDRFKFHECNYPFNFSRLINDGARFSDGNYILMLNNDVEIIQEDWLSSMLAMAQRPQVGCVGVKLLYPNDTIQHAGVIIGLGGAAGHAFTHISKNAPGYFNYIQSINNYSAVTAACLMVRREVFEKVGGFNEDFSVEYNDVDFCLRVREAGFRNVYLPHVTLYHYESLSRGHPHLTGESYARHLKEVGLFQKLWKNYIEDDPCYSPNLSLGHHDFSLRLHP